ncbi:MAG: type I methionyl aminopeptidase [Nitrospirae bacterium]|nr:type I methionyl aminopeptidase [Nitrospirota bacterium]
MIILKSPDEVKKIERAGRIVAEVLQELKEQVKPGVTTLDLDRIAEAGIRKRGGQPAFKGYRGFPATLCASVNDEIVHGIPSKRTLQEGDIIGLDLGSIVEGYYGDSAITVAVGAVRPEVKRLVRVTEESLYRGIEQMKPGNRLSDISNAVQTHVEAAGYSVVKDFVGHGIGQALHEEPQLPNFGKAGQGPRLRAGMVLAIEPMVNMGKDGVRVLGDHWTAVTEDGSLSAHFEHTVAITEAGPVILTSNNGRI